MADIEEGSAPAAADGAAQGYGRVMASGDSVAGPALVRGAEVQRQAQGVCFYFKIDTVLARVTVDIRYGAATVQTLDLTYRRPVASFALADNGMQVSGSLIARFGAPPRCSAIQGDFVVARDGQATVQDSRFRGDVVVWDSPERLVLERFSTFVSPSCEVRVELADSTVDQTTRDAITALVRLIYVDQIAYEVTVFATLPLVTLPQIKVGVIEIDAGTRILYRPATAMQSGQVTLAVKGRERYGAEFEYDGAVANWDYGIVRPRDAEHMPPGFEPQPRKLALVSNDKPGAADQAAAAAAPAGDTRGRP